MSFLVIDKDPINGHLYFGSYGGGIAEYYNDEIINIYKQKLTLSLE